MMFLCHILNEAQIKQKKTVNTVLSKKENKELKNVHTISFNIIFRPFILKILLLFINAISK